MVSSNECLKCGNYINCSYFLKCVPASGSYEHCPGFFVDKQVQAVNNDFSDVKNKAADARINKSRSKAKKTRARLDSTALKDFMEP